MSQDGGQQFEVKAILATLYFIVVMGTTVNAAAPKLTFLHPAGTQRGATTIVKCHGEYTWPVKVWAPGAQVAVSEAKGNLELFVPKELAADRIWIRLYNEDGASQAVPFLIGSLPETNEVEPNDAPSTAQKLSEFATPPGDSEVTVNGLLQKNGDVDSFAVELVQGQTLVAAVEANTAFGSPIDAILQIVSPAGTVFAENHDDKGLDPRVAFTAPSDGTYIARLFAFPAKPNQSIRFHGGGDYVYRLTLTTGPYIAHAIPMSVASYDRDTLTPTTVQVLGWNIPAGTRLPVTPMYSPDSGNAWELDPIARAIDPKSQIGLVRAPNWSGSARVRAVAVPAIESLAVTSENEPHAIRVPASITGRIGARKRQDFFRLSLRKDQSVRISVDALSLHSPLVPLVRLRDPQGKVAAESSVAGAASDVVLTHKAKKDGQYLIIIRDRFRHGGDRYYYCLTTSTPRSDFRLTTNTDTMVVMPGEAAKLVVNVQRDAGEGKIMGEIAVAVEDLPEGVTAKAIVSKTDGDSAKKITLELEAAEAVPFSGPIRIQGVEADSQITRFATTPVQYQISFDHIWLTVRPKQETDPQETSAPSDKE